MAARRGEIQTAIGWSAGLPDGREQGEGIRSPMPGNLPDNGMWPPNNIHKYSNEAKWVPPERLCGASCQRHAQEETTLLCWCAEREEERVSFPPWVERQECVGWYCSFKKKCLISLILDMNLVELISSLWMGKNKQPAGSKKWCMRADGGPATPQLAYAAVSPQSVCQSRN